MTKNQSRNLTYFPMNPRIYIFPIVCVFVKSGKVEIVANNEKFILKKKEKKIMYSNLNSVLVAHENSEVDLTFYKGKR